MKRRGKKTSVSLEDQVLITILYLRDYDTFFNIGFSFNICESYANKIYHKISSILILFLHPPSSKQLELEDLGTLAIDVAEQPVERPLKHQKQYYSGKKKRHTIKAQLIVSLSDMMIRAITCSKGKIHDFSLFKKSKIKIKNVIKLLADSGYQGMVSYHQNSITPIKKKKGKQLSKEDKNFNHQLSKERVLVENIIRRCKIFRIVKEVYRGKHKNYGKTWNLIAGLVNIRYNSDLVI